MSGQVSLGKVVKRRTGTIFLSLVRLIVPISKIIFTTKKIFPLQSQFDKLIVLLRVDWDCPVRRSYVCYNYETLLFTISAHSRLPVRYKPQSCQMKEAKKWNFSNTKFELFFKRSGTIWQWSWWYSLTISDNEVGHILGVRANLINSTNYSWGKVSANFSWQKPGLCP